MGYRRRIIKNACNNGLNGFIIDFPYTGTIQKINLPIGTYKLQCWGAQGGNITGDLALQGAKGGYSEGVLTLSKPTTLYAFVGGQGESYVGYAGLDNDVNSLDLVGGWNGGGSGVSSYDCSRTSWNYSYESFIRSGGGGTDFATVPSSMDYISTSWKTTNRTLASYLSRCIVAGGGAGAGTVLYKPEKYSYSYSKKYTPTISQHGGGLTGGGGSAGGTQTSGGQNNISNEGSKATFGRASDVYLSYCQSAAGGGGWYGGAANVSSYEGVVDEAGGGSGFVNIASNAKYRPSGYTGLQLDSGETIGGNKSFPSVSGGTEIGHSGNGYARITVLNTDAKEILPPTELIISMKWSGSYWTGNELNGYPAYSIGGISDDEYTTMRCTFSGLTSITFSCASYGEENFDYLTIGELDSSCTRSKYKYSVKSSTIQTFTYNCDIGEHFIEFCYSKDSSDTEEPDYADVCIVSYS